MPAAAMRSLHSLYRRNVPGATEKMTTTRKFSLFICGGALAGLLFLFTHATAAAQQTTAASSTASGQQDWSRMVIDSTMKRYPDPAQIGRWGYPQGLYLMGQYLVYRRTGDRRYLQYIQGWVDSHINDQGVPDRQIIALDDVLAANLLPILYEETHEEKYKIAADTFRHRFDNYPRTTDGGFWHATVPSRQWQLWLDGTYMAIPFLDRYGRTFSDSAYTDSEAVKQLLVYHKHLQAAHMGLLYHAYDESGKASWADPVTHHSAYFWCRAIGWYGMAVEDTLDVLPKNQPGRSELIKIVKNLVKDLARYQDPQTGLWYQIVDKPTVDGNWTETSSSSMFTYIIDVAVKRGYVSRKYKAVAEKGYHGVLSRISVGPDGLTNLTGICEGTNVGDLSFYFNRKRNTNDFHGLGAFLLMNEEWNTSVSNMTYPKKP
jgi:unsaturated rhamnogalacturonyl hydrolase